METSLLVLLAVCFLSILGVNVFFRARVLTAFRELQRAGIEFDASDMLSDAKIEALAVRFPEQERAIRSFTGGIRRSMTMSTVLIALITLLGAVLMYFR